MGPSRSERELIRENESLRRQLQNYRDKETIKATRNFAVGVGEIITGKPISERSQLRARNEEVKALKKKMNVMQKKNKKLKALLAEANSALDAERKRSRKIKAQIKALRSGK